jgi:hypothetical protein
MDAVRVPSQPIWEQILNNDFPDVLMLIGDQIYMDWGDKGKSNWKQAIEQGGSKGDKAIEAFAFEMHSRYEQQWRIESFQKLICKFVKERNWQNLIVSWDDHDFAWNNSVGAVKNSAILDKHQVPPRVKAISKMLFKQFRQVLRSGIEGADYPKLDPLPPPDTSEEGIDEFSAFSKDQNVLPYALLDSRWNRTERADQQMLSKSTRATLVSQLGKTDQGLMLVITGSPLVHDYLLSEQGWLSKNKDEPTYQEYDELLRAAKRPVLCLGGDVHRNIWSGRLSDTSKTPSSVLQVLSSGAAIGSTGPKKNVPSYTRITIGWDNATEGKVDISLAESNEKEWKHKVTETLPFNANNWVGKFQGQGTLFVDASADKEPIAAISFYERSTEFSKKNPTMVASLDELNDVFKQKTPQPIAAPYCWELVAPLNANEINIQFLGTQTNGFGGPIFESTATDLETLITNAFDRANGRKKSVMLYIHGIGHPFGSALAQAYRIRETYPDCEPILFAWPSGEGGSLLNALFSVPNALRTSDNCAIAAAKVLMAFNNIASRPKYNGLTKVVACRSAGSLVLQHALESLGSRATQAFVFVHRVILSSPLMKTKDFLQC